MMIPYNYKAKEKRKEKHEQIWGDLENYRKEKEKWQKIHPWRTIYPGMFKKWS